MAARMEPLEKEGHFMMGSHQYQKNRNNSVSERHQFGYDPHHRPEDFRGEEGMMIFRGSPRRQVIIVR